MKVIDCPQGERNRFLLLKSIDGMRLEIINQLANGSRHPFGTFLASLHPPMQILLCYLHESVCYLIHILGFEMCSRTRQPGLGINFKFQLYNLKKRKNKLIPKKRPGLHQYFIYAMGLVCPAPFFSL